MDALGLRSAGNVLFGKSLLTDQPFLIQTLPEAMPTVVAPADSYVSANASVSADHESLKTPGTASHTAVTQKIEQIAGDSTLTDKQKRGAINDLRKQLGLSKGDMKKFYTKPLERQADLEGNEEKRKLYASMYKAGGCVKKVFKGIGKGLGTVAKVAATAAMAVVNPASLIPTAVSLVSKIPGVKKVANAVQSGINKAAGWVDTGMGYAQKGVQFAKDVGTIFGNFGGMG
jgi:hypothetical protein